MTLIYDAGALIAAEKDDRGMWASHNAALQDGEDIWVPTVVLAQVWRRQSGGRLYALSRILDGVVQVDFASADARAVGDLLAVSGTTDVVDAFVVVLADRLTRTTHESPLVLTSDRGDLQHLADASGLSISILDV